MFKFQILLLFVGVFVLSSHSYTYTAAPEYGYSAPAYPPAYPAYPSYSTSPYGGYATGSYGNYGDYATASFGKGYANCAYTKVIEVLDQIFCTHAEKDRYSSTIFPYIDQIIDQLEWISYLVFLPDVYDYLVAASHELKSLQDSVYGSYGESNLLESYDEYGYENKKYADGYNKYSEEYSYNVSPRTYAQDTLKYYEDKLNTFVVYSTHFKTASGVNYQASSYNPYTQEAYQGSSYSPYPQDAYNNYRPPQPYYPQETPYEENGGYDEYENDYHQRSGILGENEELLAVNLLNTKEVVQEDVKEDKAKRSLKLGLLSRARATRKASLKSRKTRGNDYSDYTCSYIADTYCNEEKYDELLYNILVRIFMALNFIDESLDETWGFIKQVEYSESYDDREAYQEAAITYGAMGTTFYSLIDVARNVERMYEIMELDYGEESGSGYYRSGGSGDDKVYSAPQVSYPSSFAPDSLYSFPQYSPPPPPPSSYSPDSLYSFPQYPPPLPPSSYVPDNLYSSPQVLPPSSYVPDNLYSSPQVLTTSSYAPVPTNSQSGMLSYPYGGYISQPPTPLSYSMPLENQSRYRRDVTPAVPQAFFFF